MIIRRQACFPFEKWKKLILALDYKDKNLYYQEVWEEGARFILFTFVG